MWQKSCMTKKIRRSGIAMVAALLFIMVFMAMSAGMLSMSTTNAQSAENHRNANAALNAALSGLEVAKYQIRNAPVIETYTNTVSLEEADKMWKGTDGQGGLYGRLLAANLGGKVPGKRNFSGGEEIVIDRVVTGRDKGNGQGNAWAWGKAKRENAAFQLRFFRHDDKPFIIYVQSTGDDGEDGHISRTVQMQWDITKSADVLNYAMAGRGRMWLTGDTTIHGSIYSSYGYKSNGSLQSMSPFNMTGDTTVEGTVNTVLPWQKIADAGYYQLQSFEHDSSGRLVLNDGKTVSGTGYLVGQDGNYVLSSTGSYVDVFSSRFSVSNGVYTVVDSSGNAVLDASGKAITYGNPIETYNSDGTRSYSSNDELLGSYGTVNYGQPDQSNVRGLNISDYETSLYKNEIPTTLVSASTSVIQNGVLSKSGVSTVTEYFPHAPLSSGGYTTAASSSSLKVTRYKYENKTLRKIRISSNTNALFKNCTFEGVLYVECTDSSYNNIRFEDCTFNGTIVTSTPGALNWQKNALYFTGAATFENQTDVPATILAPNFNVDLGNTNPNSGDNNVLTGAIVGGIVDIRGNAEIYGTIISMADTSSYTSGYVTNIGVTLDDGGSETTEVGDVGTIEITPNPDQLLPSGIKTPVIFKPDMATYIEMQ